jgi:hypothetical protein
MPGWRGRTAGWRRGARLQGRQFRLPDEKSKQNIDRQKSIKRSTNNYDNARMAELVDALVSNTSGSIALWVRFPLRVLKSLLIFDIKRLSHSR